MDTGLASGPDSRLVSLDYCSSLTEYQRWPTREVQIGDVPLGGTNPIRLQSMTTTDTMDTAATVAQSIRMIEAGCEYVRITAPSLREARNLEVIRGELRRRGYRAPLVADIHFTPNAAELAARIVEKVRINPGNYADRKKFQTIDYSDDAYQAELDRIYKRFAPLVAVCKEYGTAMRIGTNHGSLSDRIMSRYGDTPLGMVESALEFLRICEDLSFHNIVLSMKASNPQVMVQAYRLLVATMKKEGMNYPLHLGVTEAGDGEDGRIKSAVGIGTLLEDGLGDTIRVSLTEEPEHEIPVARALAERYRRRDEAAPLPPVIHSPIDPFHYRRRTSAQRATIGAKAVPVVVADLSHLSAPGPAVFAGLGYNYSVPLDKWHIADMACDFVYLGTARIDFELPGTLRCISDYAAWRSAGSERGAALPLLTADEFLENADRSDELNFVSAGIQDLTDRFMTALTDDPSAVLVLDAAGWRGMPEQRRAFISLLEANCPAPVIIRQRYPDLQQDDVLLYAATDCGALLLDGLGDGLWLQAADISHRRLNNLAFGILQATRTRISKTEYISCPSCGRTLFDLQETTARIRARTNHLKGVKIGIMGCIVNGPGEMADADYGYVGSGPGKISLYRGQEVVRKSVNTAEAVDALIDLIREDGNWVESEK